MHDTHTGARQRNNEQIQYCIDNSNVFDALVRGWKDKGGVPRYRDLEDWLSQSIREDAIGRLYNLSIGSSEAFHEMTKNGVDCAHGTTGHNLPEIICHGLVPSSLLTKLGIVAIGKENFTQPPKRKGVHVVPISHINETARFAEGRLSATTSDFVNINNHAQFIGWGTYPEGGMNNSFKSYFRGHYDEAVRISEGLKVGNISRDDAFPVVLGVSSSNIDVSREGFVRHTESAIEGDITIDSIITVNAIKIIYVPKVMIEQVSQLLLACGAEHILARDIATIRNRQLTS